MDSKKNSPEKSAGKKFNEMPLYVPPAKKAAQGRPVQLPQVEAPSLEGLSVTVPAPEAFSEEEVRERFLELARPFATEHARSLDEPIGLGDEVLLNMAGYTNGRLIPFSVRTDTWVKVEPEPSLPGLYEAIVGHTPGTGLVVDLTLPDDYPVESLRGIPARFTLHLEAARAVVYPDLESPEFLQAFGRGATLDEATQSVIEQMKQEATEVLLAQARQLVLTEVARRTQVEIPPELVDEEIRRRWGASEGKAVAELEFTDAEQEESLNTWLADEPTRQEVELRLRIALALGAIVKRDKLVLTPEFVEKLLRDEAASQGLTVHEVADGLRDSPEHQARIEQLGWHLLAVEHVMKKARLHFEGA